MVEIEKPRIESNEKDGDISYGKYVVEPLEHGYGTTLGNALRRILLSSLPGTAVTTIKIAGVQHEFSTIPGVKEDVTQIVLNVKGITAKLHSPGTKRVYIQASGEGEVTAGDIKADGEVEILNPELHIATLSADATLNMETHPQPWAWLRSCGSEQTGTDHHRCHSGGLPVLPGQSGELHRGEHPCRQHDGLR